MSYTYDDNLVEAVQHYPLVYVESKSIFYEMFGYSVARVSDYKELNGPFVEYHAWRRCCQLGLYSGSFSTYSDNYWVIMLRRYHNRKEDIPPLSDLEFLPSLDLATRNRDECFEMRAYLEKNHNLFKEKELRIGLSETKRMEVVWQYLMSAYHNYSYCTDYERRELLLEYKKLVGDEVYYSGQPQVYNQRFLPTFPTYNMDYKLYGN